MTDTSASAPDDARPIRLRAVRPLRGPNLWGVYPAATGEVEVGASLAEQAPGADLVRRLGAAVPGFTMTGVDRQPDAPSAWAELVARLAVALQTAAGAAADFVAVRPGMHGDPPRVAVGGCEAEIAVEGLYEAEALLERCLRGQDADVERALRTLRRVHHDARPRATAMVLIREARRRGIPVRRDPEDPVIQLGLGRALRRLDGTMTDSTSIIATDITSDKDRTKRILARAGLPVPDGGVAMTEDDAVRLARRLGWPVLLKPLDANDGRGISGRLDSEDAVRAAYPVARAEHETVVVERFVTGRDHRVVVVDGRVVAVSERIPARVVGDGARSIRALAEEVNADPRRSPDYHDPTLVRIPLDAQTDAFLARTGRTLDTVPAAGETVYLRPTANISTGGTSIDRTDEIHPRNVVLCQLAVAAVGLDVAGLDLLTDDIGVPWDENGAVILEVNASPGIRMHTDPNEGAARDVPGAILDMLYPPGAPVTIPVLAVTGTNGKTTTTRLIAHLFRHAGNRVGFTTTDGVYYQEERVLEGDLTGPFAAGVVLGNPLVDVAVLETARGGILRSGLGYEACDVGVVLNVSADHLGQGGIHTVEQLAEVKGIIPSIVKPDGFCVLNADQPLVLPMRARTAGTVILTSTLDDVNLHVSVHLDEGGTAVVVEEVDGAKSFVIRRGPEQIPVATVAEVPLTLGGAARFQVENVLAAVAAAHARGMPVEQIRDGLMTFLPSGAATPGRMNVLRTSRGTVVVDYAHNPAALRGLMDLALRMDAKRRIGLVAMPGDRRDEDLHELGRIASVLDYVIAKEHAHYRRGRAPGESAARIAEGLAAGGMGADRYETVWEEPEAVARALEMMQPGDLVVILADDLSAVMAQLQPLVDAEGAAA